MAQVKLLTSDKTILLIDYETIKCSVTIKNKTKLFGTNGNNPIVLDFIDCKTMLLIWNWALHHKYDPPVPDDYSYSENIDIDDISKWDQFFLEELHQDELLIAIIKAAHFLHIPKLLQCCYKTVALIYGKSVQEMCETLGLKPSIDFEEEMGSESQSSSLDVEPSRNQIKPSFRGEIENEFRSKRKCASPIELARKEEKMMHESIMNTTSKDELLEPSQKKRKIFI